MPEEIQAQQDNIEQDNAKQDDTVLNWARKALLYDFYSPLLTEKQCLIWDNYYQKDYSLTEIAREQCTSRQAVHSLLQRTQESLELYEAKLGLIERFLRGRDYLLQADRLLQALLTNSERGCTQEASQEVAKIRVLIQKALDTY